jgi:uncharacterized protein involved in exopolysaccharide biosynthesis
VTDQDVAALHARIAALESAVKQYVRQVNDAMIAQATAEAEVSTIREQCAGEIAALRQQHRRDLETLRRQIDTWSPVDHPELGL